MWSLPDGIIMINSKIVCIDAGIFSSSIYADDCLFEDPTIKFRGNPKLHTSQLLVVDGIFRLQLHFKSKLIFVVSVQLCF